MRTPALAGRWRMCYVIQFHHPMVKFGGDAQIVLPESDCPVLSECY
jgi:hypothetical protein